MGYKTSRWRSRRSRGEQQDGARLTPANGIFSKAEKGSVVELRMRRINKLASSSTVLLSALERKQGGGGVELPKKGDWRARIAIHAAEKFYRGVKRSLLN